MQFVFDLIPICSANTMSERRLRPNGHYGAASQSGPSRLTTKNNGYRINSIEQKIQIQLQKQEEETRRFNEMMQEAQLVKVLYTGGQTAPPMHPHLHHHPASHAQQHPIGHTSRGTQHLVPSYPSYRGGSLPNVNQMANAGIDLQNALESLEMLRTERDLSPRGVRHPSPTPPSGHVRRHFSPTKRPTDYDANRMPHSYLLPPDQNSHLTKRAISDPLLHQSANPHMDSLASQQAAQHPSALGPNRRSPVPDKSSDSHNYLWNDPSKGMYRPKPCDIPGTSSFSERDAHIAQQQQQQQQHLLSPTSIQPSASTNQSSGSLPDLTNPSMNFPTLVSPLDPEDTQTAQMYSMNNASPQMQMSNQVRTPNSHSSSTSPTNMRRMRGPDTNGPSGGPRKSPHSSPTLPYNPMNPYQPSFVSYRSNSSSPGVQSDHLVMMHAGGSNPASPANSGGMQYAQDPHYIDMHQKMQQITMDQHSMPDQFNIFNQFMNHEFMHRNQNNDPTQIPDIIFTPALGMDDGSQRVDCSSGISPHTSVASVVNSHPYHHMASAGNVNDHNFSAQTFSQESVDLLDMFKLDQDALSMLHDDTLGHVVDPETEEQFRLDSNIH
ncbi:CREB-regulated transcription coactivator 1-like isoform X2 [Paramacrobiotus metropolitanus]|uniref:CREB-regulated transcription coactivator 1-like isoform X2 n=1 Tax=Paramacrobiotus metropolitanus TaxID=2943436 RepID=UPI0024464565|nr:CREB-regulated transcription coactivator 1-like isoform X2 [Paramacrobiotus metropolitanus]